MRGVPLVREIYGETPSRLFWDDSNLSPLKEGRFNRVPLKLDRKVFEGTDGDKLLFQAMCFRCRHCVSLGDWPFLCMQDKEIAHGGTCCKRFDMDEDRKAVGKKSTEEGMSNISKALEEDLDRLAGTLGGQLKETLRKMDFKREENKLMDFATLFAAIFLIFMLCGLFGHLVK